MVYPLISPPSLTLLADGWTTRTSPHEKMTEQQSRRGLGPWWQTAQSTCQPRTAIWTTEKKKWSWLSYWLLSWDFIILAKVESFLLKPYLLLCYWKKINWERITARLPRAYHLGLTLWFILSREKTQIFSYSTLLLGTLSFTQCCAISLYVCVHIPAHE